jgi:uncharacterized protein YciI
MRTQLTVRLLIIGVFLILSCERQKPSSEITEKLFAPTPVYDSIAAKKYGADDYGMKKYVMAFLKRGTNRSLESAKASEIMTAHLKNINRMAEEGKLIIAGPFFGSGDLRGIYIFDVQSIEEAEGLTNTDPAIQAGTLEMELMEWYGPAGLMALGDLQKSLTKKSIIE